MIVWLKILLKNFKNFLEFLCQGHLKCFLYSPQHKRARKTNPKSAFRFHSQINFK